ncbi:hypothetical protein [Polyangium sp. y55x31]|uniref:hypothetical protein n=1 Tax=Polyangium sp. y55x31 TaxID=3042688 RepID=UPI00248303E6|nr:hypothetical protein [Polyangium sp. y55x31]MDI1475693.1 hypothetical protein [Polyangium sp. y55x31]
MRKICALALWVWVVTVAGGGCFTEEAEMGPCERKAIACQNSCYKMEAKGPCFACCNDNASACRADGGYSFYSCPNKE